MWRVASKIRRCLTSDDGPTAVAYAVLAVFIIVVSVESLLGSAVA